MIIEKLNPVGQDIKVYEIQKAIHDAFDIVWRGLTPEFVDSPGVICYPRCYITYSKHKKVLDFFDSSTNSDYLNVLDSEQNKMVIVNDHPIVKENTNFFSTKLDLIFIVNLNKTNYAVTHRADEEVRNAVVEVLEKIPNTTVVSVIYGLNHIFKDIMHEVSLDMPPKHCFKVLLSLDRYKNNDKICIN